MPLKYLIGIILTGGQVFKNMNLQEYFIVQALKETNIKHASYVAKHDNGSCVINNTHLPLIFPMDRLEKIQSLSKEKSLDYCFLGKITEEREWVLEYATQDSVVEESLFGRWARFKFNFHRKYHEILCRSRFALTPTGDFPWSYRFFEAIMCHCIPIFKPNDPDIFKQDYIYYKTDEDHVYNREITEQNYQVFLNSDHFLKNVAVDNIS